MRVVRVALSVVVLLAIVIGMPSVARAHVRSDLCAGVCTATDDDDGAPPCLDVPAPVSVRVTRAFVIVERIEIADCGDARCAAVLSRAPKTSPPRR